MPKDVISRQHRAIKKGLARREQRQELKQRRQQGIAESNRRGRAPRRNEWFNAEEDGLPGVEKMRRANPAQVSAVASPAPIDDAQTEAAGTVIEIRSGDSLVMWQGRTLSARLPHGMRYEASNARSPLAVGDRVLLEPLNDSQVNITAILQRSSAMRREVYDPSRHVASGKDHVLAANIDQVVLVCSPAMPPFRPRLIDRYLVAASRDALPIIICLNKIDLGVPDAVRSDVAQYERLGTQILLASAETGEGIENVTACIAGKITLFTGHSGVGKSSLLNALEPGLAIKVGIVTQNSAGQGKGRHTTSSARLIPLSIPDTFVVDSPGIRTFGIRGMDAGELGSHFADIAALAPGCSFHDCLHRREPGCAVTTVANRDPFLRRRLESYRTLLAELA